MTTIPRPNNDGLNEALNIYRDVTRPFIVRELKKMRGTKPEDAIRQSLRGEALRLFDWNVREHGIAGAFDVNDFPNIVGRNREERISIETESSVADSGAERTSPPQRIVIAISFSPVDRQC